ncbi:hypothetical protein C8R45DRAFT_1111809 [Mycena sanguinolenta]|nr:hypothetical protein C8R45DRAFT_1111809 [Mycena sanguinolenta]
MISLTSHLPLQLLLVPARRLLSVPSRPFVFTATPPYHPHPHSHPRNGHYPVLSLRGRSFFLPPPARVARYRHRFLISAPWNPAFVYRRVSVCDRMVNARWTRRAMRGGGAGSDDVAQRGAMTPFAAHARCSWRCAQDTLRTVDCGDMVAMGGRGSVDWRGPGGGALERTNVSVIAVCDAYHIHDGQTASSFTSFCKHSTLSGFPLCHVDTWASPPHDTIDALDLAVARPAATAAPLASAACRLLRFRGGGSASSARGFEAPCISWCSCFQSVDLIRQEDLPSPRPPPSHCLRPYRCLHHRRDKHPVATTAPPSSSTMSSTSVNAVPRSSTPSFARADPLLACLSRLPFVFILRSSFSDPHTSFPAEWLPPSSRNEKPRWSSMSCRTVEGASRGGLAIHARRLGAREGVDGAPAW